MCPGCSSEPSLGRGMALRVAVMALLALLNLSAVTADHFRSLLSPLSSLLSVRMMMVLLQEARLRLLSFQPNEVGPEDRREPRPELYE